jgi:hypothetical protein
MFHNQLSLLLNLSHALGHEVKEGKLAGAAAELVNETAGKVGTEDTSEVGVGDASNQGVKTNLLEEKTGKGILEDRSADLLVIPEVRVLELLVEVGDGDGELVGEDRSGSSCLLMLAPDGLELETGVLLNLELHLLDVVLVELRSLAIGIVAHVLDEALVIERQRGKDLERRGSHTTLVGRGILVQNATSGLETELGVLGDEEVGTLNEVGDDGLAILDKAVDRDEVNGSRATTTRDEDVDGTGVTEVEGVTEGSTVVNNLTTGESDVGIVAENSVALSRELGDVVLDDHLAAVGKAEELLTVKTVGVN